MHRNPMQPDREFTPSYPARSRAEYLEMVAEGDKRDLHRMVRGGRTGVRYGEGPDKQTAATLQARTERWDQEDPPWDARTQSPDVRAESFVPPSMRGAYPSSPFPQDPEGVVKAAIARFRRTSPAGKLGFVVPSSPEPLVRAGMPRKIARILVQRAPGAFFPDIRGPDLSVLLQPPTLAALITGALGRRLQLSKDGRIVLPEPGQERGATLVRVWIGDATHRPRSVFTDEEIEAAYTRFREQIVRVEGRPFRAEDGERFLSAFYDALDSVIRTTAASWQSEDLRLALVFRLGKTEFVRMISTGEHSNLGRSTSAPSKAQYRTLQNVTLAELPRILVGVAGRKKRKGRRSQPLSARTNPVADNNLQLQLVVAAMERGELVPVEGKPGMVYWPISKGRGVNKRYVGLKTTTDRRAQSWMAIAATGKAMRPESSLEAEAAMSAAGLSLSTPPAEITARSNPMSHDDEYWFSQYQRAPYGARQSLPAARRNRSTKMAKKNRAKKNRRLTQKQILAGFGGKSAQRAAMSRSNPWYNHDSLYLPDTTQVRPALVPYYDAGWHDDTEVFSALVPGPYGAKKNGKAKKNRRLTAKQIAAGFGGKAAMRKARNNSGRGKKPHWKKKGHAPYSKFSQRRSPNYEQIIGQFSSSEPWTHGMQPMNRRNPNGMVARFPGTCCMCGDDISRGQHIADSGMRGPRGGKKMAHVNCL